MPSAVVKQPEQSLLTDRPRRHRRGGGDQRHAASLEDRFDRLLEQLERLQQQNAEMASQLSQLREENAALRRQLSSAPMTHQPYALLPSTSLLGHSHGSTRPHTPPRGPSSGEDVDMSPSAVPNPKRSRLQLPTEVSGAGTESVPTLGISQGHGL